MSIAYSISSLMGEGVQIFFFKKSITILKKYFVMLDYIIIATYSTHQIINCIYLFMKFAHLPVLYSVGC